VIACIVFLDFDGVTHPEPCYADSAFCCLPLIEAVLREFPAVEVVISSSWREQHTLDDMRAFFAPDIARRVVAATPVVSHMNRFWLPGHAPKYPRQWECQQWLKVNRVGSFPWLAIDDRGYWFEPDCKHLLLTDSSRGFSEHDAERLRSMLKERP
jgi:hypothetical protein